MSAVSFVGTWTLISCEIRHEDGTASYPYGQDAQGQIIYSADGHMSAILSGATRPNFDKNDIRGGTPEEKAAAIDTYLSYAGRYEVRDDRVIHRVLYSLFPNWVGSSQERFFELHEGTLSLRTPPLQVQGKQVTVYLIWKRAEQP